MQNKDIKRRIEQLAKQSNQLKKITLQGADFSRITNIINQSKKNLQNDWYETQNLTQKLTLENSLSNFRSEIKSSKSKQFEQKQKSTNGPFKFIAGKNNKSKNFEDTITLNPNLSIRNISNNSNYKYQEQLILLKQQNLRLELQNKNFRKLLDRFKQRQREGEIPYFKLSDELDIFYTRIFVRVEDYDKIDFNRYILKLQETTLYIHKTIQSSPWKILIMQEIKIVKYLGNMIMIEFQNHIGAQYLFIRYKDNQEQRKWDLALYLNRTIKNCLSKSNLFIEQYQLKSNLKTRKPSGNTIGQKNNVQKRKVSMNMNDQSQFYKMELSSKRQGQNQKKFSYENDRINHRQNTLSSIRRQKSQTSQSSLSRKFEIQKNKLDEMIAKNKRSVRDTSKFEEQILQKKRKILQSKNSDTVDRIQWIPPPNEQQKKLQESFSIEDKTYMKTERSNRKQQTKNRFSRQITNLQKNNKLNIKNTVIQEPSAYQFDGNASNTIEKIQQNNRAKIIQNLKKPKSFLKYAKGGFRPRDKQVYLSQNQIQLCWKDYQTKKIGTIKIQDITQLKTGVVGPGMMKQSKNLNPDLCCVIKTNERILQLSAHRKELLDKFASDLGFLIEEYQQASD